MLIFAAITRGGNHIFHHTVGANRQGQPEIKLPALAEALNVYRDTLLSPVYVGWVQGYLDEERAKFEAFVNQHNQSDAPIFEIGHPRSVLHALVEAFGQHPDWLD